jgi:hypothetical protein
VSSDYPGDSAEVKALKQEIRALKGRLGRAAELFVACESVMWWFSAGPDGKVASQMLEWIKEFRSSK